MVCSHFCSGPRHAQRSPAPFPGASSQLPFLCLRILVFPLVGFKRNLSLLEKSAAKILQRPFGMPSASRAPAE